MVESSDQIAVCDRGIVEQARREEIAVQDGQVEQSCQWPAAKSLLRPISGERTPHDAQRLPEIVVFDVGGRPVEQAAQSADAVVAAVEWTRADQPAILGHKEKEQSVDQHQQMSIEVSFGEPCAGVRIRLHPLP